MRIESLLLLMFVAGALRFQMPATSAIRGHIHSFAQARFDRGQVGDLFTVPRVTMMFKPTRAQQAELDALLAGQQDPASPNYHRWLTPEEFADRFGLSEADFSKDIVWLQDQGFTIDQHARSRNWVSFTGTAKQMETSFQTRIHEYVINGETHYAAATEPRVPIALGNRVLAFRSLHNFRPKPRIGKVRFTSSLTGYHFLAPDDFATIYHVRPLNDRGITGAGQKMATATIWRLGSVRLTFSTSSRCGVHSRRKPQNV